MADRSGNPKKPHICLGILAHVDAGKTTLAEAMLYRAGAIRQMGRVDRGDAFLDTHALEKSRGITIFSKQAQLELGSYAVTLLDTPGHVDFSAEMERTLQILDYAVLVISGADGVQGHTKTLWELLARYGVPTFLFINKMDQPGTDKARRMDELQKKLGDGCVDLSDGFTAQFYESAALCTEEAMERFVATDQVDLEILRRMVKQRELFPCCFGSALKLTGVDAFLWGIGALIEPPVYPEGFGARVFKIARDAQGMRLTYMKVTGGSLKVRDLLSHPGIWEEKVSQLRMYSGGKYTTAQEVYAGEVCAAVGLSRTRPGECLGTEPEHGERAPVLTPVLTYRALLPDGCQATAMLPKFYMLEEEEPELHVVWNETTQEIRIQVMGAVQLEVVKSLLRERFGVDVGFDAGSILYKETIADTVEGVGHFEPLRHYAEVHLLLEPGEPGSGLTFSSVCSEDMLDKNWQRLILTHLAEREHKGVLTGAPLTDVKITLAAGRAHQKHTEGGDFRQATYRAVRQGLMQAKSVLLEPWYAFRLELPETAVGRAMTDIEKMHGRLDPPEICGGTAALTGAAPVSAMRDYPLEVAAYTKGRGHLSCTPNGYAPCQDAEAVIAASGYDPERDTEHPSSSVFCSHGAGVIVDWREAPSRMHLESVLSARGTGEEMQDTDKGRTPEKPQEWIDPEEVDRILSRAAGANRKAASPKNGWKKKEAAQPTYHVFHREKEGTVDYLLVDGYNVIYAWEDLNDLARTNMASARGRLLDILCNYQAVKKCRLIAVFDAYRVKGHATETMDYHNIHLVYTKEAETADQYIEKFAHENGKKYRVTVATSDGVEQVIIRGQGCRLISARELRTEIALALRHAEQLFLEQARAEIRSGKSYLFDSLMPEEINALADGDDDTEKDTDAARPQEGRKEHGTVQ